MKTFTGREVEKMFEIPQQYRSRYDKAYRDFISPCDTTPRTYDEMDILVYQAIRNGHAAGRTRTSIAAELVEMVGKGIVRFYGDDIEKFAQPQQPQKPANADGKTNGKEVAKPARRERPKSLANLDVIVDLSKQVGELAARNVFLEERISDLEWQIDTLSKVCEELRRNQKRGLFR